MVFVLLKIDNSIGQHYAATFLCSFSSAGKLAPIEAAHGLRIDEVCQVDSANSRTESKLQFAERQYVCHRRALALKQITWRAGSSGSQGKKDDL